MNESRCTVTFLPVGKQVTAPAGTLLHDAIQRAGIEVDIPCGGQGRCGRCLVRIEQGEVRRRPNAHLTALQIAQGWALSCQTEVLDHTTVRVPPAEVRQKAVVSGTARIPVRRSPRPPRDPLISQHLLELPPPSLQDNVTDLERVLRCLRDGPGIEGLSVDLPVTRDLDQALRGGEWQVTAVVEHSHRRPSSARLVAVRSGDAFGKSHGVAVDIGTTTVAVALVDLASGRIVDTATTFNGQIACGEDIISRIIYSLRGDGLARLQRLVRETINHLLAELCDRHGLEPTRIDHAVVSGNTTMTHLFLGLNPRYIREEPYTPVATSSLTVGARDLGLEVNPNASVYCLPAVAAYVGSDITAGILSSGLSKRQGLALFLDIGTNGEMVLGNADWMAACACSAGPAFEGAGVRCGMRATTGAIEDVAINYRTLEPTLQVIGGELPTGICGSGMIAALAEMFVTNIVDRSGRINVVDARTRIMSTNHGPAYVLAWGSESGTGEDILLTEVDIQNLVRTKGAIYAGMLVMLRNLGIEVTDIEQVLIGGAFGQHINVEKSILIGLLPDLPWHRFRFLGNTSLQGAYRTLVSRRARRQVEEIAGKVTYLELVAGNAFMNEYTSTLFLPHTNMEAFPSVKEALAAVSRDRAEATFTAGRVGL